MSLGTDFLDMASATVYHAALSTVGTYGSPTFAATSAASSYPAHIETGARRVVSATGIEVVSSARIYVLSSSAAIAPNDRLELPDGSMPPLIRVDTVYDEDGQHHVVVSI